MQHLHRLAVALPLLILPLTARAYDVGTPQAGTSGTDASFTSVAAVTNVVQGNPAEPASSVGTIEGTVSGNAVTITGAEDAEAQAADYFEITWAPLGGGSVSSCVRNLTGASTVAGLCSAITSGCGNVTCQMKPPASCSSCPAENMEIVAPFLNTIQSFGFFHAAFPATLSTLETDTVTDAEADVVNTFTLTLGTTTVTAAGDDFANVSTLAELAAALDAKGAGIFDVSVAGDHLFFQAEVGTYDEFGGFVLRTNNPATSAVTSVTGVTDGHAALVNQLSLTVRGNPVTGGGIDFAAVDDATELAAALELLPGIATVTFDANTETLTITAEPGAGVIENVELVIVPSLTIGSQAPTYMEGGSAQPLLGVDVVLPDDATIASATVLIAAGLATIEDELSVSAAGTIVPTYDAPTGILTLTGPGTVPELEATLASLAYTNASQAPSTTDRRIEARIVEDTGLESEALVRIVQVEAVNDVPLVSLASTLPAITVGTAGLVLEGAAVFDVDDTTLVGATVAITAGFEEGDVLAAAPHASIASSWDAGTHVLSLTGTATLTAYQDLLQTVTLLATRERPGTYARSITVVVRDAHDVSVPAATSADVTYACADGTTASGDTCVPVDTGTPEDPDPEEPGPGDSPSPTPSDDGAAEDPEISATGGGGCSALPAEDAGMFAWLVVVAAQLTRRGATSWTTRHATGPL